MTGDSAYLAEQFEEKRGHLRAVAYRMLGSLSEAEDAVQEAWFRLDRTDTRAVENLGGWLTTVVARVCLDQLRSRKARREESLDGAVGFPEPLLSPPDGMDPEQEVLLADSVGLALLVVLEQLAPAERLSFVLHDMFGVPFDEIAPIVERTPAAARQLASRARRRVQGGAPAPDVGTGRQKEIVGAFLAAARGGSFEGLIAVLDPDVVLRVDLSETALGAQAVARQALTFQRLAPYARPALVNGVPGLVTITPEGKAVAVMGLTVSGGRIVAIDILADPERLQQVDVTVLD
ncbi:sigma-70 family RNA polymerase sigma factor [Streptomyces xanthophaeus]|uniref:DNA-directed RNA polymerase sigma-70 factor n=1 Tax=Streptomyces xanthophaeus TaxID=67385 RepID=A0A919LEH0_9ACTN|nr:sigma-70 family RNA polymerase sigma factor [Streptomyces xanthophaeus]GHI88355.1 DNA-directed RNA polymerase sigma-70 factor [Streptomyces xanthophaeus]